MRIVMKRTGCREYLCILFLIIFYDQRFFPFLIICVILQVDEVFIGVSFRMCMYNFVWRNNTGVVGKWTKSCTNRYRIVMKIGACHQISVYSFSDYLLLSRTFSFSHHRCDSPSWSRFDWGTVSCVDAQFCLEKQHGGARQVNEVMP